MRRSRHVDPRTVAAAVLIVACMLGAVGYVALAAQRTSSATRSVDPAGDAPVDSATVAGIRVQPHLLFLESQGDADRTVAVAPLAPTSGPPARTSLNCQRVHFNAGRGLCLNGDGFGDTLIFDEQFEASARLAVQGIASRARVAADGRHGAVTTFVSGHSYAEGRFSTQTTLIDMQRGLLIGDLEQFEVFRDGRRMQAPDFNFWGVTFGRDSNRFYATLGTAGQFYLVAGDVATRQLHVLRDGVECPSLSPDNSRLVFKKRIDASFGRQIRWRLHVLDLATMSDMSLAEERNVDDQVEWLDDHHLIYSLPDAGPPPTIRPDLWVLPVDDGGPARRFAEGAFSPSVVR